MTSLEFSEISDKLDYSKYELEFEDVFTSTELDGTKWLPYYLPQWKSREASKARYRLDGEHLRLQIEMDQNPWAPEHNGEIRVSNLQTGVFSGPLGTPFGQHRFREGLVVQEIQTPQSLYTPTFGLIEMRAQALQDPACMVALWMIGTEVEPTQSSEICIMEVFGKELEANSAIIGVGVHPFFDSEVSDDFSKIRVEANLLDFHTYSVEWKPKSISFYFDGQCIKIVRQSIEYPMQLMLNIYEFSRDPEAISDYPKEFVVDWVRGFRSRT